MPHLVNLIEELKAKGISFKSIQDGAIDTTTASGELIFNIFSSLAQFERKLIQERTRAGLNAAKKRGNLGGRPKIDPQKEIVKTTKMLFHQNGMSMQEISEMLRISKRSGYRYLKIS